MNIFLFLAGGICIFLSTALALKWRKRASETEKLLNHTTDKLEQLQQQFERFAPADLVERLAHNTQPIEPERRTVTVLFADLVGFTHMCDQLDPAVTVNILNGYFQRMSEAILFHQGRVTELIGDGILALFGALEHNPWQGQDAVKAGFAMRQAMEVYNRHLRERGLPELAIGIGIHQGEVLAGVMGNNDLSKFGVVGDTINVAARVEALTRLHGVDLLVTEEVQQGLDDRYELREMPATEVKGKPYPIVTYHVVSIRE